jgi:hypothetical protein
MRCAKQEKCQPCSGGVILRVINKGMFLALEDSRSEILNRIIQRPIFHAYTFTCEGVYLIVTNCLANLSIVYCIMGICTVYFGDVGFSTLLLYSSLYSQALRKAVKLVSDDFAHKRWQQSQVS